MLSSKKLKTFLHKNVIKRTNFRKSGEIVEIVKIREVLEFAVLIVIGN